MPIPFLAGFALGCAAVYAYNNRDKIKEGANKIVSSKSVEELKNSVKGGAEKLSKKSKEIFAEAKEGLDDVAEAVKSKRKSGGKKATTSSASTETSTAKKKLEKNRDQNRDLKELKNPLRALRRAKHRQVRHLQHLLLHLISRRS